MEKRLCVIFMEVHKCAPFGDDSPGAPSPHKTLVDCLPEVNVFRVLIRRMQRGDRCLYRIDEGFRHELSGWHPLEGPVQHVNRNSGLFWLTWNVAKDQRRETRSQMFSLQHTYWRRKGR